MLRTIFSGLVFFFRMLDIRRERSLRERKSIYATHS